MASEVVAVNRSRRAVLAGVLGAVGAFAARALAGGSPMVEAADGDPVKLGDSANIANNTTIISNPGDQSEVDLAGNGYGVWALGATAISGESQTASGFGVKAYAGGSSGTAIQATTSGYSSQTAIYATTNRSGSPGEGISVDAVTKNGIAVRAQAVGGAALEVHGVAIFDRAGYVSFAKGQASKTVPLFINGAAPTLVVATIQGDVLGTWVRGVVVQPANQRFVIKLNRAAPKALSVGYFVVN